MSQETKNKNEQPKDEAVSEQVSEKELPVEEPKESAENAQEAKAEEAKKEEKPSELDTVKEQLAKEHDGYLRLAAEYDNFRKRTQNERKNIYGDAVSDTLTGLLPIIDNLQYAAKYSAEDSEKLAEGLALILSKLPETLDKLGIKPFGEPGDTFDPSLHNAVMHVEDEAFGEGEIVEVLQQGYKYGEKVIRYAIVKVAN